MDRLDNIKLMNDLVLRTERGEQQWEKTKYAGIYILKNSNGEILIGKKNNGNITFKILGEKGDVVTDDEYFLNSGQDLQVYKVSNVLWLLVKDLNNESRIDFKEILDLLEEEE